MNSYKKDEAQDQQEDEAHSLDILIASCYKKVMVALEERSKGSSKRVRTMKCSSALMAGAASGILYLISGKPQCTALSEKPHSHVKAAVN
eukprot:6967840-Ditylum_brightwellii.AAC.1